MPKDTGDQFEDDVFTWQVAKAGKVRISWRGRIVTTVVGMQAQTLVEKIGRSDHREVQHLLATATGNFKRGNERQR